MSSGGNYTLSGTVGQPDAGTLSGGNYTLEGGFWPGIVVPATGGAPTLFIQLSTNNVIISRSEEHTSELQSRLHLVCRLLLEKKKNTSCNPIRSNHSQDIVSGF